MNGRKKKQKRVYIYTLLTKFPWVTSIICTLPYYFDVELVQVIKIIYQYFNNNACFSFSKTNDARADSTARRRLVHKHKFYFLNSFYQNICREWSV